jgi:3-carboxy-cis,cis-muconate cycloisomerase
LFRFTAGAIARVHAAVRGLRVNAERMSANLESDGGLLMAESLSMALARKVGRPEAQRLVKEACERAVAKAINLGQAAQDVAAIRANLSVDDIKNTLNPANYLGSADALIDRALESYRKVAS